MRRIILLGLAGMMLLALSCGGGGGDELKSDADRFVGDWNGTMVETGNDYGGDLDTVALQMHIEYAGKQDVGGVTVEYISLSIFFDGALAVTGTIEAMPGGTWNIDLYDATGARFRMLGQFVGNTASGSWEAFAENPDPPYETWHTWGTWSASR